MRSSDEFDFVNVVSMPGAAGKLDVGGKDLWSTASECCSL